MIFIPDYTVSYKGEFYYAGEEIEIDEADVDELSEHGEIEEGTLTYDVVTEEKPEPIPSLTPGTAKKETTTKAARKPAATSSTTKSSKTRSSTKSTTHKRGRQNKKT